MFAFKTLAALFVASASLVSAAPVEERSTVEARTTHTGQATYFATGLGACGWWSQDTDMIVALNSAIYEENSGSNCGQGVWITNKATGATAYAVVTDECPTCDSGSLDMSPSLFSALSNGNMDEGVFPISWHFLKR
ncbi:hypothetical protein P7C73_g4391, partial [Tremellales sp. Uapishka_1]